MIDPEKDKNGLYVVRCPDDNAIVYKYSADSKGSVECMCRKCHKIRLYLLPYFPANT